MKTDNIPSLDGEEWRDIPGYEGLYQVSSFGRILKVGLYIKLLKLSKHTRGYSLIHLRKNGVHKMYSVHRIVANVFLENVNNLPYVCHKDETFINGRLYNGVDNLFWGTQKDNIRDMILKGRSNNHFQSENHPHKGKKGYESHNSIPIIQYDIGGKFIKRWGSIIDAKRQLKILSISANLSGKYKHAGGFIWRYEKDINPNK